MSDTHVFRSSCFQKSRGLIQLARMTEMSGRWRQAAMYCTVSHVELVPVVSVIR